MRVSDDRYSRDRLRYDLALRLIRHEARTHTIRQWTGLTDDRIRKLYRSYALHEDTRGVLLWRVIQDDRCASIKMTRYHAASGSCR